MESTKAHAADVDAPDLDAQLPSKDLQSVRVLFWRRWRLKFPPAVEPADTLLSRSLREINLRLLSVKPLSKVQSDTYALQASAQVVRATKHQSITSAPCARGCCHMRSRGANLLKVTSRAALHPQ